MVIELTLTDHYYEVHKLKALVLAGGDGSRIRPYSDLVPKCLLPVRGIPCVRLIVDDLLRQIPDVEVVLCINKRFEPHFCHEFRDLNVKFSVTDEPKGTAGEICAAAKWLRLDKDPFLVIYGDDLTKIDYAALLEFHNRKKGLATLVVTPNVSLEFGVVSLGEDQVVCDFKEKPMYDKYVWTGKCMLDPAILQLIPPTDKTDLSSDVFPQVMPHLYGYVTLSLWLDIGNVAHYLKANGEWK